MILLILVALLLVAVAGAGLLGIGVLSADQRQERAGIRALLSAPVILVVGVALLGILVVGVGGGGGGPDAPAGEPVTPTTERPRTQTTQPLSSARVNQAPPDIPVVVVSAADEDDGFVPYRPVSGLVPDAVVRVKADGFGWHEGGSIEQCVVELGRQRACGAPSPVQFDEDGRADFQFAVRADISPGGCRVGRATCMLRVAGTSGTQGFAQTVLVDRVSPGQVRVEPAGALAEGQTVDIVVAGFPPATTASAVLCAPPEHYDARRCGVAAPASTFTIDATGAGRTSLRVVAGRLGVDAALCGPRRVCGVAVVVGDGYVAAPVTPVRFSMGPGVAYEAGRLVPGVLVAVVLIGVAVSLAVRTDWTRPAEAGTPALDASDLRTGQSLDDLFGTDEELDARDPVPW